MSRKEYMNKYNITYQTYRKQHAVDSITSGEIINQHMWNLWCNRIRSSAKKYPYSEDFTNDIIFIMMTNGCFYCGDIATTIDRIDSKLNHTIDNCIASCHGCNISKGTADSSTFIRKAYYRSRREYVDDNVDIWSTNETKPTMAQYKYKAKKKGVSFNLSKKDLNILIKNDCEYCHRTPVTWFGIDRMSPSLGYVLGNVVSCCFDCNLDKLDDYIDTMSARNERITNRLLAGELIITDRKQTILHRGIQKSSKKVCAYGNMYVSKAKASRALGNNDNYVGNCIRNKRYLDDIFEISDEFYEMYKDCCEITRSMFIAFDHFYTNM